MNQCCAYCGCGDIVENSTNMNPGPHQLLVTVRCAVTVYYLAIPLVAIRNPGSNTFDPQLLRIHIQNNQVFVAAGQNVPIQMNTATHFYVILIKLAVEENIVFAHIPEITTLKSNWRILICNRTGSDIKARDKTDNLGRFKQRTYEDYKGVIHIRHIVLDSLIEEAEIDADNQEAE